MIGVKEVAFTGYPVTEMDRARAFYGETLGLDESWVLDENGKVHWVEYDVAGHTLALALSDGAWKPSPDGAGICLEVEDLDAAINKLEGAGVTIAMPIGEFPMCRMAVVSDPDGNGICLHQKKPNHPECDGE
jgi:predicted enzyme related to lactoylglutathione lyase